MHRLALIALLTIFAGGTIWLWGGFGTKVAKSEDIAGDMVSAPGTDELSEPTFQTREYTVAPGDTFTIAMEALDIPYSTALAIVDAASSTFDFTRIRDGRTFVLEYLGSEHKYLRYEPDSERIIVVDFTSGDIVVREEAIEYDVQMKRASATIESSLFVAGATAGLEDALILEIADVFAWTIDFATQVQAGDSFRIYYEERYRDGKPAGFGNILAAEFVNNGHAYYGYLFEDAEGKSSYYDEDGNSLIKQFLKAPLTYNRITSGFSYSRFHPTLGKNTPHRAIDYAAPIGTPVMSVGDGTVVFAGWSSVGYGNFVKVRHNSTYETHYAHLSRIAVSVGQVVEQGQVIGYVGSTGYSTGPHLHYEIQKNGTLVNPLEVELPAGDPVTDDLRDAFTARRDELHTQLMN